jgi:hypothetical protein
MFAGCAPAQQGLTDPDRLRPFDGVDADVGGGFTPDLGVVAPDGDVVIDPAAQISIATFNVKRFFDTQCQLGECGPDDFEGVYNESEFDARARRLANGMVQLDADIVLLQEFETQMCLDALANLLGEERYPVALLAETGNNASLDVAVLARGTLIKAVSQSDSNISHVRVIRRTESNIEETVIPSSYRVRALNSLISQSGKVVSLMGRSV